MATTTKKMTEKPVVQCIVDLIREQRKKEKDITDYLGISLGTMSKWKCYGSSVYIMHMVGICEFLDTKPNYLFFGLEDKEGGNGLPWRKM